MADLFNHVRQRSKPRKLMHAFDAGEFPDGKSAAAFKCVRCDHHSGWIYASLSEIRRGVPCPQCEDGRDG